ncbi:hypothetical protein [uncultured Fibrella sp.]|uniref:hypothetical protein n=1 Tax=uncultured Fibrella sp. TaxID=1284596 RepID=UPI0035CC8D29
MAQTADLRVLGQLDCATGQYSATLQLRASGATSFSIGTSSLFLNYDPTSLTFTSYQSQNFDANTLCSGQPLWDVHSFDGSTPGSFNLTISLNSSTISCPLITNTAWVSIGTITFTVLNPDGNPALLYNPAFSSFNAVPANNGLIQVSLGQVTGVNQAGVLRCAPPCSISLAADAGSCIPATNSYTLSGTVAIGNTTQAGVATITAGTSQTVGYAPGTSSIPFSFTGLISDGLQHTVTVSNPSCGSALATYTAPASCSCIPPTLSQAISTPATCNGTAIQATASVRFVSSGGDRYSITPTNQIPTPYSNSVALVNGTGLLGNLPNPTTPETYLIRVYQGSNTCFIDRFVVLQSQVCDCPASSCLQIVVTQIR